MSETRPTLRESLSKTAARASSRGLREVAGERWRQLQEAVRSDGALKLMTRAVGGEPPGDDLRFTLATPADAEAYARDIGTDSAATFRRRLSPTTDCCLVRSDDTILHASWLTTSRAWTSEIKAFLAPPQGDAYIYESFTRSEARGRGVYPFALLSICHELGLRGLSQAWVAVEVGNQPSIRAITKAGFSEGFEIRFRRRGGRVLIDPPAGPLAETATGFISGRNGD
ncbi:MAG: hypothetical protein M3N53_13910 [Actinomycetota bacterium]|nr:hypothetical protein [Actinomycetota bacterium]